MRYRRLSYRYAVAIEAVQPWPLGFSDTPESSRVRLAPRHWAPSADVYETPTAITVMVELAGVDPDELDVQLFDDALTIAGHRTLPRTEDKGVYHAAQIRQGAFHLNVALPMRIDVDHIDARSERGLLVITLPKPNDGAAHDR